jgi:hypothetical protein
MATEPKPKSNRIELHVTEATYNEIATAMQASGQQLTSGSEIVLTKDIMVKNPLDLRMVSIRKDAAEIAAKAYGGPHDGFIEFADKITDYILHGKKKPETAKGWK